MPTNHVLPNPEDQPTVPIWPTTAKALDLSRSSAYLAAQRNEIPGLMRIGGRWVVATAALRRALGLDRDTAA